MSIIKSFAVDNGDTYYIKHSSNNFTVIDCNLIDERRDEIIQEIIDESNDKQIKRFISTHPDEDHIYGIEDLDERAGIPNFYCVRNSATKDDPSVSFKKYCELRDSSRAFYLEKDCSRCWMNMDDTKYHYGCAGIAVLWPIVNNKSYQEALNWLSLFDTN